MKSLSSSLFDLMIMIMFFCRKFLLELFSFCNHLLNRLKIILNWMSSQNRIQQNLIFLNYHQKNCSNYFTISKGWKWSLVHCCSHCCFIFFFQKLSFDLSPVRNIFQNTVFKKLWCSVRNFVHLFGHRKRLLWEDAICRICLENFYLDVECCIYSIIWCY